MLATANGAVPAQGKLTLLPQPLEDLLPDRSEPCHGSTSTIKILHTTDMHRDAPLKSLALNDEAFAQGVCAAMRTAFPRIVDRAMAEDVSALLISEDLFDGPERSARTSAYLTTQLNWLRAAGIPVFYIKGNQDAENPITGEVDLPDNVHVIDGRGGKVQLTPDIWMHVASFAGRHALESLLPKFPHSGCELHQHRDAAHAPGRGGRAPRTETVPRSG